jgi:hypothetical protein
MFDYLRDLRKSAEQQQQEALHAYLDDALAPKARRRFEQALARNAALRARLEEARQVQYALRQLPRRPAPRNFTLDPAAYGRPQAVPLVQAYPALRVATALTAFLFVVVLAANLFLSGGLGAGQTAVLSDAPQAPAAVAVMEAETEAAAETAVMTEAMPAAAPEEEIAQAEALAVEVAADETAAEAPVAAEAPALESAVEEPAPETAAELVVSATDESETPASGPTARNIDPEAAPTVYPAPLPEPPLFNLLRSGPLILAILLALLAALTFAARRQS